MDKSAGWLAGFLDGEGSVEKHGLRVSFSQNKGNVLQEALSLFDELDIELYQSISRDNLEGYRTIDMASSLRLLGSIRPIRLLENISWEGTSLPQTRSTVEVVRVTSIGTTDLIGIGTETKTLIAEGVVSHNSPPFPSLEVWELEETWDVIESNWQEMLRRRDVLEDAMKGLGLPPMSGLLDKKGGRWECRECAYLLRCKGGE